MLGGLAVAGGIAALFLLGPNTNSPPEHFSALPATHVPPPVKAKFTDEERRIAGRSAVLRGRHREYSLRLAEAVEGEA